MKKLLLSVACLVAINSFAQDKVAMFESHTLTGDMVVFEGTELSTGEKISTRPYHIDELQSTSLNGNNVRYWLFEGCYKYELATVSRLVLSGHSGGWSIIDNNEGSNTSALMGHELTHVVQQGGAASLAHELTHTVQQGGVTQKAAHELTHTVQQGGVKYEIYNAKEWVRPCPSH